MSKQLKMLVGAAMFAVLAFVGMLGVLTFTGTQPVQAQQNTTAMRSFDPDRMAPGGSVTVTIQVGQASKIIETLPDGFTYAGSRIDDPDDDNDVLTVGQTVTFTPIGEPSFTYTVTAPETEDEYTFSGVAQFDTDRDNDLPVGGASTVTVEAVIAGDPLVNAYDANGNGTIDKEEVIAAINDYLFAGVISKEDVIKLINLYLFGPSTPHNRPGAPEGLTAAGNGQTEINLSWTAPTDDGGADITGYKIEVSPNGSSWSDLEANTLSTSTSYSHSHSSLTAGSTHHYRVSAINSAGTGPASNVVTGTTDTGTTAGNAATDRAALVALYNATDGANWRRKANWQSEAPIGEWYGVTTDSDGRVTHLALYSNQLTGEIPAELGDLSNLEVLTPYSNQLTGEIPAELGGLTNLESLDLAANQLTGEIPAELGGLTNLVRLDLAANQLTGEIPAELGGLTNLVRLDLAANQLTGEIPAELGGLTNLESLDLAGNQLTGEIPAELGSLTNLKRLRLDFNQLTGGIPPELGNLTNLELLQLEINQLTGGIPAELGSLTNLTILIFYGNQLTGEIPAELGGLTNLELLSLRYNQLTGEIPAELGGLPSLRWLYLSSNQLTGEIPAELGNLSNLISLYLSSNQLTGCIPAGLRNTPDNDLALLGLQSCGS